MDQKAKDVLHKYLEPAVGVFFTTLFLVLFNFSYPQIQFITREFDAILPFYNFTLIISIGMHSARFFITGRKYKLVTEVVNALLMCVVAVWLWQVFPFDTSVIGDKQTWDNIFRFLIAVPPVIALVANSIAVTKYAAAGK